jgi:hypothetical protein
MPMRIIRPMVGKYKTWVNKKNEGKKDVHSVDSVKRAVDERNKRIKETEE